MVWRGDDSGKRVARSLLTLYDQVEAAYPQDRDRSSDGTIGDSSHQATHSEHNPDENGVVRALDVTNDPAHGLVSRALAQALLDSRDPRLWYVISNNQIAASNVEPKWQWRPYNGPNPHTAHMHISVVADPALYDDTRPWMISGVAQPYADGWESGRGSWYSQNPPNWIDTGDEPNSNALGVDDSQQGIAFYDRSTLGKWFDVKAPNGHVLTLQQTDIGPHPRTGRTIDIAAVAAERFGYSPNTFPTDGIFSWRPASKPADQPVEGQDPVEAHIEDMLTEIDDIVADLRKRADTLEVLSKALQEKQMADTKPQPQVDWSVILDPIVKAVMPELMKLLPQLLPKLLPLLLPILLNVLTGRTAVVAAQTSAPASSMPQGSLTGILGLGLTLLSTILQSRGILTPDLADPAAIFGLGMAGTGGVQVVADMRKSKQGDTK